MVKNIDFDTLGVIVEYGAGTGVFTAEILKRRNPGAVIIVFEMNERFCNLLHKKFGQEPGVFIVNGSAIGVGEKLWELGVGKADCIVSGLPFASLPEAVSHGILQETVKALKPEGEFVTFQYTLLKMDMMGEYFKKIEISREYRNVPPAYVLRCV